MLSFEEQLDGKAVIERRNMPNLAIFSIEIRVKLLACDTLGQVGRQTHLKVSSKNNRDCCHLTGHCRHRV